MGISIKLSFNSIQFSPIPPKFGGNEKLVYERIRRNKYSLVTIQFSPT